MDLSPDTATWQGLSFIGTHNGIRVYKPSASALPREHWPILNQPWILENENGDKAYFLNGKLHRVDGPAVEKRDGTSLWFINGEPSKPYPFGEEGRRDLAQMIAADLKARVLH